MSLPMLSRSHSAQWPRSPLTMRPLALAIHMPIAVAAGFLKITDKRVTRAELMDDEASAAEEKAEKAREAAEAAAAASARISPLSALKDSLIS